jgi:hypothetical protein
LPSSSVMKNKPSKQPGFRPGRWKQHVLRNVSWLSTYSAALYPRRRNSSKSRLWSLCTKKSNILDLVSVKHNNIPINSLTFQCA